MRTGQTGQISHIDISVSSPDEAIPFYEVFFISLGYKRWNIDAADWQGEEPKRASWSLKLGDGSYLGFEVRPASAEERDRQYNRYEPGPHHMAFNASSTEHVDKVHEAMLAVNAKILDPPTDYGGQQGYGKVYYAVFFADPDGFKLEVVYLPGSN